MEYLLDNEGEALLLVWFSDIERKCKIEIAVGIEAVINRLEIERKEFL